MNAAIRFSPYEISHVDPGWRVPAALALSIHLLLFAVLFFGVRWQSRVPEVITAELWTPPPLLPVVESPPPAQVPDFKPAPPPPAPAPAESRPEPVKPDIVIREPVKPKADPVKPKPEPVKPKPEPVKPKIEATKPAPREAEMQKRLRDELAREQTALSIDQEKKLLQDQVARDQALQAQSALNKARATYGDKIKAKIKGNIVLPQDLKGNPEAVFEVVQLPTGEVLSVRLKKSSGHRGYDEAVERAILKASPLPLPERAEVFSRALSLTFRPQD